jgi:PTS system fructose-specific IIC component
VPDRRVVDVLRLQADGAAWRLFVLLIPNAINHALLYLLAIVAGSLVTAVVYAVIKKGEQVELAVAPVKG